MGADASYCTLKDCIAGYNLGDGAGGMVIILERYFYSESVVTLEAIVKFASEAELYLSANFYQYD